MDACLNAYSLRKLTKTLTSLTRFGEDVHIQALPTELIISALNLAKTSYAQLVFSVDFFEKYRVNAADDRRGIICHLNAKALLGVLKSRGQLERTVETCDIVLTDPEQMKRNETSRSSKRKKKRRKVLDSGDEDDGMDDSMGSLDLDEDRAGGSGEQHKQPRLDVVLNCKHGFRKSHSLFISTAAGVARLTADQLPTNEASYFIIPPRSVSAWLEPFPSWSGGGSSSGSKKEGHLGWAFAQDGVTISSWEGSAKADALNSTFFIEADQFDEYQVNQGSSVALGFPMREFKAVIQLAITLSVSVKTSFAVPGKPISISLSDSADVFDASFAVMTQPLPGSVANATAAAGAKRDGEKRRLEKPPRRSESLAMSAISADGGSGSRRSSLSLAAPQMLSKVERHRKTGEREETGDMSTSSGGGGERQSRVLSMQPVTREKQPGRTAADYEYLANDDMPYNLDDHPATLQHFPSGLTPLHNQQEPLFYPSQESAHGGDNEEGGRRHHESRPPASQLTQPQLEALGLGGLEEADLGLDAEELDDAEGDEPAYMPATYATERLDIGPASPSADEEEMFAASPRSEGAGRYLGERSDDEADHQEEPGWDDQEEPTQIEQSREV